MNLIDSRIPEQPIGEPFTGLLDARWSSGDDLRSVGGLMEGGEHRWNYHFDGFYRETGDIDIPGFADSGESIARRPFDDPDRMEAEEQPEGTVPNSDTESYAGAAGVSYTTARGFVGISMAGWSSKYGVPGHAHEEAHDHGDEAADGHAEDHEKDDHEHGEAEEEGVRIEGF